MRLGATPEKPGRLDHLRNRRRRLYGRNRDYQEQALYKLFRAGPGNTKDQQAGYSEVREITRTVTIKELRLLARSVFIIDRDGTVQYIEVVPEVTDHPDYEKALDAARKLVAQEV